MFELRNIDDVTWCQNDDVWDLTSENNKFYNVYDVTENAMMT